MKILHIDTGKEMRGGQIQAMMLIKGLRAAGHDNVLLSKPHSPLWEAAKQQGIQAFEANLGALLRKSGNVDIVHAHDAHAHTLAAIASRRPFVVSRRVAFPVKRSLVSKWKYARARRFIAVSRFVSGELQAAGIPSERIDVVYDGVEIEQEAAAWDGAKPAVALASRDPQKGRALIERAAHTAQVPVVFSTNLKQDLLNASMFAYISESEGLGSATLLAMAMGVPVIASQVGGLSEVFEHNVSGIYVRNLPEEIAAAMATVGKNPELAARLIQEGKSRVRARFSKQQLVEGTLRSYERALAA